MKSDVFKLVLICLSLLAIAFGYLYWSVNASVKQPLELTEQSELTVKRGQSFFGLLAELEQLGWFKDELAAKVYARVNPSYAKIKTGTYDIYVGDSLLDLLSRVSEGKEKQFSINLIEGKSWREWLGKIESHPQLTHSSNDKAHIFLADQQYTDIEGLLLPDTYFFTQGTQSSALVERANKALVDFMQLNWPNRALDLPYDSQYQALILASIVEKETGLADERARIAGVFVNRLRLNMRLQTDPTVIYGMGERFDGNIRRADLREKTPYNTYVIKGLPPTPIAMPSKDAILAVLNPLETQELYFVSRGDGSHKFSNTLAEHNAAVRKYQLNK